VPSDYGAVLSTLTETIASGHGSRPNGDVLAVTGVAPTPYAEFAVKTAAAWSKRMSDKKYAAFEPARPYFEYHSL
jgi:hypothetical protein